MIEFDIQQYYFKMTIVREISASGLGLSIFMGLFWIKRAFM